jgi:hypothetical protein
MHNNPTLRSFIHDLAPDLISLFLAPAGILYKTGSFVYRHTPRAKSSTLDTQKFALTKTELVESVSKSSNTICDATSRDLFEDLHWADFGTLDLLFYLAQRITQEPTTRFCIFGSYRIVDAMTHSSPQSSIISTVLEMNRYFGNTVLDITDTASDTQASAFVDAIIDRQPNLIEARFREELAQHTECHPLFTIELFQLLQMREKLYTNSSGKLVASTVINFQELPDKVEAIIAARMHWLNHQLTHVEHV